jgi:spoIIIJ-associated protein
MNQWIETSGKTEEEAIQVALDQLGRDRDAVSVEIMERAKSGFLGLGGTLAKVRVTYASEVSRLERVEDFLSGLLMRMNSEAKPKVKETEEGNIAVELIGMRLGS